MPSRTCPGSSAVVEPEGLGHRALCPECGHYFKVTPISHHIYRHVPPTWPNYERMWREAEAEVAVLRSEIERLTDRLGAYGAS